MNTYKAERKRYSKRENEIAFIFLNFKDICSYFLSGGIFNFDISDRLFLILHFGF